MSVNDNRRSCYICKDLLDYARIDNFCVQCRMNIFPFNNLSDIDFSQIISNDQPADHQYKLSDLENKIFNPELVNEIHNNIFADVDPDLNFYNNQANLNCNCSYYLEDGFNTKINGLTNNSAIFSLIHLNIRSAPKNLNKFEAYLHNIDINFNVIGLTETWFNENNIERYTMQGYNHEYEYRKSKKGGGVSMFIAKETEYTLRSDLVLSNSVESVFIELDKGIVDCNRKVVMGCIYRPPDTNLQEFLVDLNSLLNKLSHENKSVYLMGDFNINLLNSNSHSLTADFIETLFSYFYIPLINKPTRVKENSATIIDNIFSNDAQNCEILSGILYTDLSDHFPIFCILNSKDKKAQHENIFRRSFNEKNKQKFRNRLLETDWANIIGDGSCQDAFSKFHSYFRKLYDDCFPLIQIRKSYKNRKNWLTIGLKNSIKVKNKMYIVSTKYPTSENKKTYSEYKRTLSRILKQAEREHYDNLFKQNVGNIRKSWEIIKEVINKSPNSRNISEFIIEGNRVTNANHIANAFNDFYLNIGTKISQSLPIIQKTFSTFMPPSNPSTIFLRPTTCNEVMNLISEMKRKCPGWDGLDATVIKETAPYFVDTLTSLINKSMAEGIFPTELKIAKVIPLYKNNDATLINNYRPVSILPLFSKIFEKIMYARLMSFINKHNLLYNLQFGFRKGYNTNLALITLIDKLSEALDNGNHVVGVFLDFSKAFDTVNHNILLKKLNTYGIRGIALKWLSSYLNNRTQYVNFNDENSRYGNIKCGVPQGSVLGPLLYLIYVNDIVNVSPNLFPILFADDTNIFLEGNNIDNVVDNMNLELNKLMDWTIANKLSLNVDKTNYMIFSMKGKRAKPNRNLYINNRQLKRVEYTKFLGVIIDDKLSWNEHVKYIKNKMSKGIGILCKARKLLNVSTLVNIYNSFIYPYITYGIEVWGSAAESNLKPIINLQKRAVRIVVSARYRDHTAPIFKSLKLLPFKDAYIFSVAKLMFKIINNYTPRFIKDMFTPNCSIHQHLTRQRQRLRIPRSRTNLRKITFRHRGVTVWNDIVDAVYVNCSFNIFKRRLKEYLLR